MLKPWEEAVTRCFGQDYVQRRIPEREANSGMIFIYPGFARTLSPFTTYRSIAVTMGATSTPALAAAAQSVPILKPKFFVFHEGTSAVFMLSVVPFAPVLVEIGPGEEEVTGRW